MNIIDKYRIFLGGDLTRVYTACQMLVTWHFIVDGVNSSINGVMRPEIFTGKLYLTQGRGIFAA